VNPTPLHFPLANHSISGSSWRQLAAAVFTICWAALCVAGCAPVIRIEQPERSSTLKLQQGRSIGQSFVARYDGLEGVELYLKPGEDGAGEVVLSLKPSVEDASELASSAVQIQDINSPRFYKFTIPNLGSSSLKYYYFSLSPAGSGTAQLGYGPAGGYLNGSAYRDGEPLDAQLTFRLVYDPEKMILGLAGEFLRWIGYLLIAGCMIVLPGWALTSWLLPVWKPLDWLEKTGLSIGAGMVVYPLILLWSSVIGVRGGQFSAFAVPILASGSLLIRGRSRPTDHSFSRRRFTAEISSWVGNPDRLSDLAFLILFGLIAFTRLWAIRSLDAPMWGDSYQHTLISRLILDHNGLFRTWTPYADLQTFTYHFGFHSLVASFQWLTALDTAQATLYMGQITNILAVIALYPLGSFTGGSRWSGVLAVLIAGLLSPHPMAYVNWGRYTQLAGQAILPASMVLIWLSLKTGKISWKSLVLIWILLAGLFLTHYRVMLFALIFYLAFVIVHFRKQHASAILKIGIIQAIGGFALASPWLIRILGGKLPLILGLQLSTPASQLAVSAQQDNAIGTITSYLPAYLWILLGLSVGYALWTRKRDIILFSLWAVLVFLAANPGRFGLPGTGVLSNFAVFIAAYIPAGIITGASLSSVIRKTARTWWVTQDDPPNRVYPQESGAARQPVEIGPSDGSAERRNPEIWMGAFLLLISLGLGAWGFRARLQDVKPAQHALVTRSDVRASFWIRDNLDTHTTFLVNSLFAYGGSLIAGSDAGWWLPLTAGRRTTLPPLNYGSELGPFPGYLRWVNQLAAEIEAKGIGHPDTLQLLEERDVTYVYIGQQQGRVNDADPLLQAEDLLASPAFSPVYHQDRVWIFKVEE
jgi:hypothetical protein